MIKAIRLTCLCFMIAASAAVGQAEPQRPPDLGFTLSELNLSPAESRWLSAHDTVRVSGPRAFPPFHYFDDSGELKGMSADYLFAIMKALGLKVDVAADLPWGQVLDSIRAGTIDLIPCIAKTDEREGFLNYSQPYLSFPLVILSRREAPFIGGVEDLYGKTLAIVKNNATPSWLARDHIRFVPYYVESPIKRIEAISLGRVDAGIENLAAASYIISKYGLMNVKVAAPTPYGNYDIHMAVRKDMPELLGIVNKVLDRIGPETQMQMRSNWLSVRYEHGIQKRDIFIWVLAIIGLASVILGVVLSWNQVLKREVARRKDLIRKLETALAEIKTLKGIVPICSNCKKIRNDQGYWDKIEVYIEKHSDASFSHSMCPECQDALYGDKDWYRKRKKS